MKKISTLLLALIIALSVLPAPARAESGMGMAYCGDYENTKMTPAMARAFAEVLRSVGDGGYGLLVDPGDGWPILLTSVGGTFFGDIFVAGYGFGDCEDIEDLTVWEYIDGGARAHDFAADGVGFGTISLAELNDGIALSVGGWNGGTAYENTAVTGYYTLEKGVLSLRHWITFEWAEDFSYYREYVDGEEVEVYTPYYSLGVENLTSIVYLDDVGHYYQDMRPMPAAALIDLLESYASTTVPEYQFDLVDRFGPELLEAISALDGQVEQIYKLSEGVYYAIVSSNGELRGVVLREGPDSWDIGDYTAPLNPEDLLQIAVESREQSNVELDYSQINTFSGSEEAAEYLNERLEALPGAQPNDRAKDELTSFIESAVTSLNSVAVESPNNTLDLSAGSWGELAQKAADTKDALTGVLSSRGVLLNKEPVVLLRAYWSDADLTKKCAVTLDTGLPDALGDARLRVLLGDGRHYLELDPEDLRQMQDLYGALTLELTARDNEFELSFLDSGGERIPRLPAPVTIGLPAEGPTSTVTADIDGEPVNWGGQYDPAEGVIVFKAPYTAVYMVEDKAPHLTDMDSFDEETRAAAEYLVSKGIMTADGGQFRPQGSVTRYDFTKAVVSMFFALERDLPVGFTDVPDDSPFYDYVASARANGLVNGVSETEFGGDGELTVEQMLTLAGRVLQEHRGYQPPESPEYYLQCFTDSSKMANWAREQSSLSIREGLIPLGGKLTPKAAVDRAQAAVILYRLFYKLQTVTPVLLELPSSDVPPESPPDLPEEDSQAEQEEQEIPELPEEDIGQDEKEPFKFKFEIPELWQLGAAAGAGALAGIVLMTIIILSKRRKK